MKRIITAVILVPLVVLLIFKGSFPVVLTATALVAELAAWEYLELADRKGTQTPRVLVLISIALIFAATFHDVDLELPAIGLCSLGLFVACSFRSPLERVLPDTAASVFALMYIGFSLTTIPLLWSEGNGASLVLFLLVVVWSGDAAALYAGRAFGRRKLAPRISPNKTWIGSGASIAGSLLITVLLYFLGRQMEGRAIISLVYAGPLARWLLLAVVVNIAAQVGDLVESAIKRGSGVKDSGKLLPGHGGVLDRIDALLLAAPVLWYAQLIQ